MKQKIATIRQGDSLFRCVNGRSHHNEFEYDIEDGYVYVYIHEAEIIDSNFNKSKKYRFEKVTLIMHKDSINYYNFDSISRKYKFNVNAIKELSQMLVDENIKIIYSILLGDCSGCANVFIFHNEYYYVIENIGDHCYPHSCFSYKKAKTKKLSEDIQWIKNGKKLKL